MPCHRTPRRLSPCRRPASRRALLTAATLAALAATLPAQIQFGEPAQGWPVDSDDTRAVALGDVDGDGDVDAVFGNPGQSRLYRNDGFGRFTDVTATHLPQAWVNTQDLALGDVDGDGDLDLVLGNAWMGYYSSAQTSLYLNDGSGSFTDATATNVPVDSDPTTSVALGDVDGDGDLDLVIGNGNGTGWGTHQNRLYLNGGNGVFTDATATHLPAQPDATNDVVLGDIDADGDLDLVVANGFFYQGSYYWPVIHFGEQNRLLRNDGTGVFTDVTSSHLPVDNDWTRAVALGDVDGDGDLDLAFGNNDSIFQSAQNRLLDNDGTGHFTDVTAARFPVATDKTHALVFADVDGDLDLDLFAANEFWGAQGNRLFANDGAGTFADATVLRLPIANFHAPDAAFADLDGDLDLDLVAGAFPAWPSFSGQNRLFTNLRRQLAAPLPFQIGQTWTLEAHLRHGQTTATDFALPALSLATGAVAVPPFGLVGIDPNTAVTLPLIAIPQPLGTGSLNLQVPVIPGLIGTPIYAQALLISNALPPRFSNVVADEYTPLPAPTISSIQPMLAGPGTPVTITGTGFLQGIALSVGGVPTPIVARTPTTIDFTMPAGSGCDAAITLANLGNSTASQVINHTPVIASVSSSIGPAVGGAPFTITGQHLANTTVSFNGAPMTITSQTESSITGTTPPGSPGPGVVIVTNPLGCLATAPYTYDGTPVITSVTPIVATGGTLVVVQGSNFLTGLTATVGGVPAVVTSLTATRIDLTMPLGLGCDTTLALTYPGHAPATRAMNGTPVVTGVLFPSGPAAGGALFVLSGSNLSYCTVLFNGVPMTNISSVTQTAIVGYTPPGAVGQAVVVVRNTAGCQTTTTYTYQ